MNKIFREINNILEFNVYLVPGASKIGLIGLYQADIDIISLKIAVHSKPINNQANLDLIKLLSELFVVTKSCIIIKRGLKSRHKVINIFSYNLKKLPNCLQNNILEYLSKIPKTLI